MITVEEKRKCNPFYTINHVKQLFNHPNLIKMFTNGEFEGKELDLYDFAFVGDDLRSLLQSLITVQNPITTLKFVDNEFMYDHFCLISNFLQKTEKIESLSLGFLDMREYEFEPIAMALKINRSLRILDIGSNEHLGDKGLMHLTQVLEYTNIQRLYLQVCGLNSEGIVELSRILPKTKIVELSLSRNRINMKGAEALAKSLPSTKIKVLYLHMNPIETEGILTFKEAIEHSQLETLSCGNGYCDYNEIIKQFSSIMKSSCLTSFDIHDKNIEFILKTKESRWYKVMIALLTAKTISRSKRSLIRCLPVELFRNIAIATYNSVL